MFEKVSQLLKYDSKYILVIKNHLLEMKKEGFRVAQKSMETRKVKS